MLCFLAGLAIFNSCEKQLIEENGNSYGEDEKVISSEEEILLNYEQTLKAINFSNLSAIDELQAESLLSPLKTKSLELVYYYGYTDGELVEEFGSIDDVKIINLAIALYAIHTDYPVNLGEEKGFHALGGSFSDCLFRALGIDRLIDWATGKYLSGYTARKALIQAVGKSSS